MRDLTFFPEKGGKYENMACERRNSIVYFSCFGSKVLLTSQTRLFSSADCPLVEKQGNWHKILALNYWFDFPSVVICSNNIYWFYRFCIPLFSWAWNSWLWTFLEQKLNIQIIAVQNIKIWHIGEKLHFFVNIAYETGQFLAAEFPTVAIFASWGDTLFKWKEWNPMNREHLLNCIFYVRLAFLICIW